jgi:hypothetical protein
MNEPTSTSIADLEMELISGRVDFSAAFVETESM